MEKQLTYKVSSENEVLAKFESHDDAMRFAEVTTQDGTREVAVEDPIAFVTYYFTNGYINKIK